MDKQETPDEIQKRLEKKYADEKINTVSSTMTVVLGNEGEPLRVRELKKERDLESKAINFLINLLKEPHNIYKLNSLLVDFFNNDPDFTIYEITSIRTMLNNIRNGIKFELPEYREMITFFKVNNLTDEFLLQVKLFNAYYNSKL